MLRFLRQKCRILCFCDKNDLYYIFLQKKVANLKCTEVNISPKYQYFFTDPKDGPVRESRSPWFLASNIFAQSPKRAIFLHIVVIFLSMI